MSIDIRWLIYNSNLKDLTLLTCPDCLDTPISSINIMDNPEVIQWMKPNELVLTTGYVFVDNPELQSTILNDLKAADCSALCIKTKRFLNHIPEHMLNLAEKLHFPIIELPLDYSFSDISKLINDKLCQDQFQDVFQEQTFYNRLFNAYFEKKHITEILEIFSEYLLKSVFLMTARYQSEWFSLVPEDCNLLDTNGELEITSESFAPLLSKCNNQCDYCSILLNINHTSRNAVILPFKDNQYYLGIFTEDAQLLPMEIIQHALKIIMYSGANIPKLSGSFHRYYDSFFQFLLNGPKNNELEDTLLCNYYGFPYEKPRICLLLSPKNGGSDRINQKIIKTVTAALKNTSCKTDSYFIAWNQNYICIYLFGPNEFLRTLSSKVSKALQRETENQFIIGISRTSLSLNEIPTSYKEASFMLLISAKFKNKTVLSFQDYFIFWMIHLMTAEEQQRIYEETVKPLADYDEINHSELMLTLLTYFECNYNSSLTSEKLYIHRNTFLKRISKIRNLISFIPDDIHNLSSIYCGLCIYILNH